MTHIYISKKDVKESVWETLCESALGHPIDESHELLDVVLIKAIKILPCEPKSTVCEDGKINRYWIETTSEEFKKV